MPSKTLAERFREKYSPEERPYAAAQKLGLYNRFLRKDPNVDPTGVPHHGLRAALSRADTDEERRGVLAKMVGERGWTQDRFGQYAITPEGMDRLGVSRKGSKPVLVEDLRTITRYDVSDIAGEAPAMLGAAGASVRASPLAMTPAGFLGATALTAAGAATGKLIGETAEQFAGENIQPASDVLASAGREGLYAAGGEALFRGLLRPAGRYAMAPQARRMTPEMRGLRAEAEAIGAKPSVSQITKAPILGRSQAMMNRIFGDPLVHENSIRLNREMNRLAAEAGPKSAGRAAIGDVIIGDISNARKALAKWASSVSRNIDELSGGAPVVPTTPLKDMAAEIQNALPKTAEGAAVFVPKELIKSLDDVAKLADNVTVTDMQAISQRLFEAIGDDTIIPGISGRHARQLWKATKDSFGAIEDETLQPLIKSFRSKYAQEIRRFDNNLIKRIMRNPRFAGRLEPEQIVGAVFRKGQSSVMKRLKNVVGTDTWTDVRRAAMDDLLENVIRRTDDPLEKVFAGKQFLQNLDKYGRETLTTMFGEQLTNNLYRFGRVTQLVTQRQAMAGGLVAANIALHPLANLPRLIQLNILSRLLNTSFALRWLTEGIKAPKSRAAAAGLARIGSFITTMAEQHTQGELQ